MALAISSLYLGLGALLLLGLSAYVISGRWRHRIAIGPGEAKELEKRIRAHGNCAEYLPMLLLIVAATELVGAPGWVTHLFGVTTILSRALHALGLIATRGPSVFRALGMVGTFAVLSMGGLGLIAHAAL